VSGDQQKHPLAVNHGPIERGVDSPPGAVKAVSVQVDDPVRLHLA
jgi:hypothetical protein